MSLGGLVPQVHGEEGQVTHHMQEAPAAELNLSLCVVVAPIPMCSDRDAFVFLTRTGWKWMFDASQEASSGSGDAALATSSCREGSQLLTPQSGSGLCRP